PDEVKKLDNVVEKLGNDVVEKPVDVVANEKDKDASVKDKNKASSFVVNDPVKMDKVNDKENDNVPVNDKHKLQHDVVEGSVWDVVNDVCLTINEDNVKEKSVGKGKKSTILKQNATSDISKDKPKNNVPKKNSRDVKEKWKIVVEKSTVKSKAKPEVKSKAKPEVKSKA
ncbi:hypothetical protein Tco_0372828, partial [Tanacetum coccineum]